MPQVISLPIFNQVSHHPVHFLLLVFLALLLGERTRSDDPFLFGLVVAEVHALVGIKADAFKGQLHGIVQLVLALITFPANNCSHNMVLLLRKGEEGTIRGKARNSKLHKLIVALKD